MAGHLVLEGCVSDAEPRGAAGLLSHSLQFLQLLELSDDVSPAVSAKSLAVKPVVQSL